MRGDLSRRGSRGGGIEGVVWVPVCWSIGRWRTGFVEVFVCLDCLSTRNGGYPWYAGTDNLDFCTKEPGPELPWCMIDASLRAEFL